MTPLQTLEVRAADIRGRLAVIGGMSGDDMTDDVRSELTALRTEYTDNESRQSALKVAGDVAPEPVETATPDAKLLELRNRVGFGPYVAAAMAGYPLLTGAEAEYNAEKGIREGYFPMELLGRGLELETRAARDGDGHGESGQLA